MKKRFWRLAISLIAIGLVAAACGDSGSTKTADSGSGTTAGGSSSTNFSPSKLVWAIDATVFAGRCTDFGTVQTTLATPFLRLTLLT